MLPEEKDIREAIREALPDQFSLADQFLQLGYSVFDSLCSDGARGDIKVAKTQVIGLWTKECKQYRSIRALCELGLTEDADVLLRSSFEASLVLMFLCRDDFVLRRGNKQAPSPPGSNFDMPFRAELYRACIYIQRQKLVRRMLDTPGLEAEGQSLEQAVAQDVRNTEYLLGEEWMKWLRDGIIAGLSVEQMASVFKLQEWYVRIYKPQSAGIHAVDAYDHLDIDDTRGIITPKLDPDVEGAKACLMKANMPFWIGMAVINDAFSLPFEEEIRALKTRNCDLYATTDEQASEDLE